MPWVYEFEHEESKEKKMADLENQNPSSRSNGEDRINRNVNPSRQNYSMESTYHDEPLSLGHLEARFERMYEQVEKLMRTQMDLAKTEVSEKAKLVGKGAAEITTGGALTFFGGQALVLAAILGLAFVVELWLSALIVGAALAIVGAIIMASGRKDLKPQNLKPERTMREMKKNARVAKEEF